MAKGLPAIITPEVLRWARSLDMITVDELANKLNVSTDKIRSWETGDEYPTLCQAKQFAKQCRVPFAYFYLPDIPKTVKRLEKIDYRTFNNSGLANMSRELSWLLRDIEERRDSMLDLVDNDESKLIPMDFKFSSKMEAKYVATAIRDFLEFSEEIQIKFRKPEKALAYCISKLEEKGFLVFQAAKIAPEEMRGLSVSYSVFPIIVLNRKDEYSARLFTLLHELTHIFTHSSGICNDIGQESKTQNVIELFCNEVAGLALIPEDNLKRNKNISKIKEYGFEDIYVRAIARDFSTSREVVAHRLMEMKIIDRETYYEALTKYTKEYMSFRNKKKKDGFLPPAIDKGTQVGKMYAKEVLAAYNADKISPIVASNYLLGLRVTQFTAMERWCF